MRRKYKKGGGALIMVNTIHFIKPSADLFHLTTDPLKLIEYAGRICYNSTDRIDEGTALSFARGLYRKGHLSVFEHVSATFLITCSRACSHQIVRHRLCSYSQESQRYVKYEAMLPVIELFERQNISVDFYIKAFNEYKRLLSEGNPPQRARLVLPNSTATKLLMTTNLRQWLHIIEQRTSPHADEEIRYIFKQIRETLFERLELGKIIANEELL